MQNKLQELTDKIYNEGILKARQEAEDIIQQAKEDAKTIVSDAEKQAKELIANSNAQALEQKKNLERELVLTSTQAINALKQQISEAITLNVVKPPIKELFNDKNYIQSLILKVIAEWGKTDQQNLLLMLPETDKAQFETFFKNNLSDELNKQITIEFSNQVKSGFKIGAKADNYQINFSETDFVNFFKAYLRPKTSEILFNQK